MDEQRRIANSFQCYDVAAIIQNIYITEPNATNTVRIGANNVIVKQYGVNELSEQSTVKVSSSTFVLVDVIVSSAVRYNIALNEDRCGVTIP